MHTTLDANAERLRNLVCWLYNDGSAISRLLIVAVEALDDLRSLLVVPLDDVEEEDASLLPPFAGTCVYWISSLDTTGGN
jgi:hypothetical protein